MGWWVSGVLENFDNGKIVLVSWVLWVIISITLHELGHGIMAIRCGDDIPLRLGHMTLNPLVHIPNMAWICFAIFGFTWGRMPVQPANFRGRYDDAKVAAAGPLVNLLLFLFCVLADATWLKIGPSAGEALALNFHTFFYIGAKINAMGMLFNLLPVPPLDGSVILGDFFPRIKSLWYNQNTQIIMVVAGLLLFSFGGRILWPVAETASIVCIQTIARTMGADWQSPYIFSN